MAGNVTAHGQFLATVEVKTADYTIVKNSDNGKTFTNEGAAGAITFALPAATVGQRYKFYAMAAQEIRVDPNGTETIALPSSGAQGAAGAYNTFNAVGEWMYIECVKAGQWECMGYAGTITAV